MDHSPAMVKRDKSARWARRTTVPAPSFCWSTDIPPCVRSRRASRCSTRTPTSRFPAESMPRGSPSPGVATTTRSTAMPPTRSPAGGSSCWSPAYSRSDDHDRSLRAGAIAAHRDNYDVHEQALSLTFRDDVAPSDPYHHQGANDFRPVGTPIDESGSINLFSPHNYWHDTEASGAAIYNYGGWFDGAYAHSAIKRFLTVSTAGSRLILGPWNHGGRWHIDPSVAPRNRPSTTTANCFASSTITSRTAAPGIGSEHRVHYFTMGENRWKASDVWPPPSTTRQLLPGP